MNFFERFPATAPWQSLRHRCLVSVLSRSIRQYDSICSQLVSTSSEGGKLLERLPFPNSLGSGTSPSPGTWV